MKEDENQCKDRGSFLFLSIDLYLGSSERKGSFAKLSWDAARKLCKQSIIKNLKKRGGKFGEHILLKEHQKMRTRQ